MRARGNRVFGAFFRCLEERAGNHLKAQISQSRGDDFLAAIMPVLTHFGQINRRRKALALAETLDHIAHFDDIRVACAKVFLIHIRDDLRFGFMAIIDLLHGGGNFADCGFGAGRIDCQRQQIVGHAGG